MSKKTTSKNWQKDLSAGFVVSLIALPLGLGLALASGAPPISGIIACVIGGSMVALLGGSYVTITGPGNGLAVATLVAITSLGGGDLFQGYLYTLGAIVFSGALLFLLGVFRAGSLGDFFPSSAVQGMLAAIGIIIMSKQFHLMLGEDKPDGTQTLSLLSEVPQTIGEAIDGEVSLFTLLIGVGSLLIMFLYSRVRNRLLRKVPAPMWVVLLSIGTGYYFEWFSSDPYPIPPELMVTIPDNLVSGLQFPDFSLWNQSVFWSAVMSLTLISCIESLLSIKGVERLDTQKRRVNINKDLRAIGLSTIVSGLLGGLNVVAVIARSSVNVNNGAQTRKSNLFHALFLLVFIVAFKDVMTRIPLPALAAILVFTGFKLTSPERWMAVYKIGWEQFLVFVLTLFSTISLGLIWGITIGIGITFFIQLATSRTGGMLMTRLLRPNVLLYQEDDEKYVISVKNFSNFLNFSRLKNQLDACPPNGHVIVDFSLAEFVDNSSLENLGNYSETFASRGGILEIVGLDNLQTKSIHPFAPWKPLPKNPMKKVFLSKRQTELSHFSEVLGGQFVPEPEDLMVGLESFSYFRTKMLDVQRNAILSKEGELPWAVVDLDYHEGEFIAREVFHTTFMKVQSPVDLPGFYMDKELLIDRVANLATHQDINIPEFPEFSRRFKLRSQDESSVISFFTKELVLFFESNPTYHIETSGNQMLILKKERLLSPSEIKGMVSFATRLQEILKKV